MADYIDPYQLAAVRSYLLRDFFMLTGTLLKTFGRLGDRLAASVLMCVDWAQLSDPEMAKRIAIALSAAFAESEGKSCRADRVPALSINLLERLLVEVRDPEPRRLVGEALVKLKDVAARMRSEPDTSAN